MARGEVLRLSEDLQSSIRDGANWEQRRLTAEETAQSLYDEAEQLTFDRDQRVVELQKLYAAVEAEEAKRVALSDEKQRVLFHLEELRSEASKMERDLCREEAREAQLRLKLDHMRRDTEQEFVRQLALQRAFRASVSRKLRIFSSAWRAAARRAAQLREALQAIGRRALSNHGPTVFRHWSRVTKASNLSAKQSKRHQHRFFLEWVLAVTRGRWAQWRLNNASEVHYLHLLRLVWERWKIAMEGEAFRGSFRNPKGLRIIRRIWTAWQLQSAGRWRSRSSCLTMGQTAGLESSRTASAVVWNLGQTTKLENLGPERSETLGRARPSRASRVMGPTGAVESSGTATAMGQGARSGTSEIGGTLGSENFSLVVAAAEDASLLGMMMSILLAWHFRAKTISYRKTLRKRASRHFAHRLTLRSMDLWRSEALEGRALAVARSMNIKILDRFFAIWRGLQVYAQDREVLFTQRILVYVHVKLGARALRAWVGFVRCMHDITLWASKLSLKQTRSFFAHWAHNIRLAKALANLSRRQESNWRLATTRCAYLSWRSWRRRQQRNYVVANRLSRYRSLRDLFWIWFEWNRLVHHSALNGNARSSWKQGSENDDDEDEAGSFEGCWGADSQGQAEPEGLKKKKKKKKTSQASTLDAKASVGKEEEELEELQKQLFSLESQLRSLEDELRSETDTEASLATELMRSLREQEAMEVKAESRRAVLHELGACSQDLQIVTQDAFSQLRSRVADLRTRNELLTAWQNGGSIRMEEELYSKLQIVASDRKALAAIEASASTALHIEQQAQSEVEALQAELEEAHKIHSEALAQREAQLKRQRWELQGEG